MNEVMNSFNAIINDSKPTLVEFYATWCPHCKRMAPIVEGIKELYEGRANVVQIEGETVPELMDKYGITAFPGWVLFKDGQEVWHDMGEKPASELEDMINRFI